MFVSLFMLIAAATAPAPPNVVVIFCDDLGYGDVGCYGSTANRTPNIDALATEGMRFTSFYVSNPACTPSRAALMTGRHPRRSGLPHVLSPDAKNGMPEAETTLAELLKSAGYATAHIGKWHMGDKPEHLPTRHGFDYYYGIPYSNDMDKAERNHPPIPLYRNESVIEQPVDQDTLTKRYTEEARKFIASSKDRRFFLYLAHSMPHVPLHVSDAFRGKSDNGLYGDVIEELDWSVGEVMRTLREMELSDNTLVIFTSDNGPWLIKGDHGGIAGPLKLGKGSTFEGGIRVPAIAWWPGHIPAATTVDTPVCTLDLLPTIARLAGAAVPESLNLDGTDIANVLLDQQPLPERPLYFFNGEQLQAVRVGDWKYKRPFSGKLYDTPLEHPALLHNLTEDIAEQHNLAEQHPEKVQAMEQLLLSLEKNLP